MKNTRPLQSLFTGLAVLMLAMPVIAQQPEPTPITKLNEMPASTAAVATGRVSAGQKQKLSGIVLTHEGDSLLVRDYQGTQFNVSLNSSTRIKERKSNPFRGAKKFDNASLTRGLAVEINGHGDDTGALVAEEIKFSETELRVASSVVSVVTPVEGRVAVTENRATATENRMTMAEENAKRLSGQLEELTSVANTANGGAKAAQETADKAMSVANNANERITTTASSLNQRISSLDDYVVSKNITLNFKVGSAVLSPEAKLALDEIAAQATTEKGYVIQVSGYASSDGNEALNRRLSQRRAEAVMSYLIENHDVSQRRIVTPLGFGAARPAADNATREGRQENRRVEVAILVNNGLVPGSTATTSSLTPHQ